MNKNKIIFGVIGGVIILMIIWGVTILNKQTSTPPSTTQRITGDFSIWIVGDNKTKFEQVVNDFKSRNGEFSNAQIKVESFSDWNDYYNTLQAAFIAGQYPDVFVLNSTEKPVFLEQVEGINPSELDPNDFRKQFQTFFGDDLIEATDVDTADGPKKTEFVIGAPVGYETLGLFYNRKFVQAKDVANWAAVNNVVADIREKHEEVTPIGMGNGSVVPYAADIIVQFFMLDSLTSLPETTGNKMKQGLDSYMILGEAVGENGFNKQLKNLKETGKNALDMFSKEEVAMVAGYPRMIQDIDAKGFKSSFLGAAPFPNYFNSGGKTLVNYNYYVVNRNSRSIALARAFVLYLASEAGEKAFLEQYPYYLPAHISLETDFLGEKIDPDYNIIIRDFVRDDNVKSSYNKGIKSVFDQKIIEILDDEDDYQRGFDRLRTMIVCQTQKVTQFTNLSTPCQ